MAPTVIFLLIPVVFFIGIMIVFVSYLLILSRCRKQIDAIIVARGA